MKKYLIIGVLISTLLRPPTVPAQTFSLDTIIASVTEIAGQYEFDPSLLRPPTTDEWNYFWTLFNNTLQTGTLEDLAWMRPYASLALTYLDGIEVARPYAEWLRQRMDYLIVAEEVVREEQRVRPLPSPRPAPPHETTITPPRPPATAPATPKARTDSMDLDRWVRRIESRPPPARAAEFVSRLQPVFRKEGVPPALVWLAEVESSFNPSARSPVGALGLFQFMPATAERFGLALTPEDERLQPDRSAVAAARYLKFLHGRFDSWPLALAAYNAGEGRVGRLLRTHRASTFEEIAPHLPTETRLYVPKIEAVLRVRAGADLRKL